MERIQIEKIQDHYEGGHPNIQTGFIRTGFIHKEPKVGEEFILFYSKMSSYGLRTTAVVEIIDKDTFRTANSTYKIHRDEESDI